jgi:uncharacterized protein YbgA (DUF1722 family)/uncharacterized protein YbbK (DUF523 family)
LSYTAIMKDAYGELGPVRIGISSCLLGQNVRYDGGHKKDGFIAHTLAEYFEFVPVCPEVDIGLGTPRETIRLEGSPESPRLVAPKSGNDLTVLMQEYSSRRLEELLQSRLHGYILKKDSPSCGMERVRVYSQDGKSVTRSGRGLYAAALMQRLPLLPVEEEGRLNDPVLRENFIERVFGFYRWTEFLRSSPKPRNLIAFHTRQKLTLLSHSPKAYSELGRIVADAGGRKFPEILDDYATKFMDALKIRATRKKQSNVLYHLVGYLKKTIGGEDKQELVSLIENYREGLIPLIVPITLLKHHFRKFPAEWVEQQVYLNPYPAELMLRNHV